MHLSALCLLALSLCLGTPCALAAMSMQHHADEMAVLALVPTDAATHRAVADGNWSNSAVWHNGQVPDAGARVVIPADRTVVYNQQHTPAIWTLRIDGALHFAHRQNTRLLVDTIVVNRGGTLTIGTPGQPVATGITAEVMFVDDTRPLNDPGKRSLGLLSFGSVFIHGQGKRPHLKLAVNPVAGDASLQLQEEPSAWQVGDSVLIAGTIYNPDWFNNQNMDVSFDEVRTITAINGNQVVLDSPLRYDHTAPRSDLRTPVGNLSRNVVFTSQLRTPLAKRGHVMFMHEKTADVRYAQFKDLGRTDKSQHIDLGTDNVPGRYPIHLHHNGTNMDEAPALIIANVVWGSPGVGYVHHSSFGVFDWNIAYDVFGSSFMSESGDETGRWAYNLAVKTEGNIRSGTGNTGHPKNAAGTFNIGNNGTAYYFQSRLVYNYGNIAASHPGWGHLYFHRATANSAERVNATTIEDQSSARYKTATTHKGVSIDSPSIQGFANNEVIASGMGLIVIKNHPNQHHDDRSIMENFLAWNVQNGVTLDYTGHYLLKNFDVIGRPGSKAKTWYSFGMHMAQNIVDMCIVDFKASGFHEGLSIHKNSANNKLKYNNLPGNIILLDGDLDNNNHAIQNDGHTNNHLTVGNAVDYPELAMQLSIQPAADLHLGATNGSESITVAAIRSDTAGTWVYGILADHTRLRNLFDAAWAEHLENGFYRLPGNQPAMLSGELLTDRLTGKKWMQDLVITVGAGMISGKPDLGTIAATSIGHGKWSVNSAPAASPDLLFIERGQRGAIDILANDTDIDGDSIALVSVGSASYGSLSVRGSTVTYTAEFGHVGYDGIDYTITDPDGSGRQRHGRIIVHIGATFNAAFDRDGEVQVQRQLRLRTIPGHAWQVLRPLQRTVVREASQIRIATSAHLDIEVQALPLIPQALSN